MPRLGPMLGKGLTFLPEKTATIATAPAKAGELGAFFRGPDSSPFSRIVKVSEPRHLTKFLGIFLEDASPGQEVKILVSGMTDRAMLAFGGNLEEDADLTANVLGSLSPAKEKGKRIVAYNLVALAKQNEGGPTYGTVFFDGVGCLAIS